MTTPADVAIALGRPEPAGNSTDALQWQMWIGDTQMLIQARLDQLGLGSTDILDQAKLDFVTREAVAARVRRPDDATQVEIAVDDGRTSRTYSSGTGLITIRDEWWDLLGITEPASSAQSFSTRPAFTPDRVC